MNYVIETLALLKSVVLSQPSTVVADGEKTEIPFVATDVEGNTVTNYESIARTTNTLSLTASDGYSSIEEKADGTAKFVFTDDDIPWSASTTYDNVSRSIALTTVVVGGDSNNLILAVDDKARPVAVKSVNFRDNATTAVVSLDVQDCRVQRLHEKRNGDQPRQQTPGRGRWCGWRRRSAGGVDRLHRANITVSPG